MTTVRYLLIAIGVLLALAFITSGKASAQSLAPFAGTRSGPATVVTESEKKERYKCNSANGLLNDGRFVISIICANGAGSFNLRSYSQVNNGALSGTWELRSHNHDGTLSGNVAGNQLTANIMGPTVNGRITARRDGGTLHISASFIKALKSVTVTLR